MPLIDLLGRVYPDRRDRYGYTILSRSRAIRAIKGSNDEAVRRLIDTDVLNTLATAQVILSSRIVRGNQDEYVFLIQKRIRPALAPSEWSPTMFADAAQLVLRAEEALCSYGMTVDDPHPWNILFDEGKPYIVDMGAFNVADTGLHWSSKLDADIWPAASVFNAFFLNVVALAAAGRGHLVRRTLTDWNPISGSDTALLLLKSPATLFPFLATRLHIVIFRWAWRLLAPVVSQPRKAKFKSAYLTMLRRYVERMRACVVRQGAATDLGKNISPIMTDAIRKFLDKYSVRWILVFGANRKTVGYIHHAAGRAGLLVVSPDEALIDSLYRSASSRMAVAVMDLRSPTPGAGPGNRWISPAVERYKSEVGIFFFDLKELVIEKCLTVSELIQAALNMSDVALIVFSKLPRDNHASGRDYGQTADQVLLACLEQNLEAFEVVYNDSCEMAVTFGRSSLTRPNP